MLAATVRGLLVGHCRYAITAWRLNGMSRIANPPLVKPERVFLVDWRQESPEWLDERIGTGTAALILPPLAIFHDLLQHEIAERRHPLGMPQFLGIRQKHRHLARFDVGQHPHQIG